MLKKIWNLLLGIIFSFLILSCNQKEDLNDARVLKKKIHATQDFKNYKNSILQLTESGINGELSIKNVDKEIIKQAFRKSKSAEEFAKYCKIAGMKGAMKFAEIFHMQRVSIQNIVIKYPDLRKLTAIELKEIFKLNIKPNFTDNAFKNKLWTNLKAQANDKCTIAWLNTVGYYSGQHIVAQQKCILKTGMNWLAKDTKQAILDMNCSFDVYFDFINLLNMSAVQYNACYS